MKNRILLVGDDQALLLTRASLVKARWGAEITLTKDALDVLRVKAFDVVVLCHSLEEDERVFLVDQMKQNFPGTLILALERSQGAAADLDVHATAVSTEGPQEMFKAIEALTKRKDTRVA